jgi:hypothetical protein
MSRYNKLASEYLSLIIYLIIYFMFGYLFFNDTAPLHLRLIWVDVGIAGAVLCQAINVATRRR